MPILARSRDSAIFARDALLAALRSLFTSGRRFAASRSLRVGVAWPFPALTLSVLSS